MSQSSFPTRAVLFASVALNLLIVGGIAGAWGAGVRVQREAEPSAVVERMPGPGTFLRELPPEVRAVMREELVDSWAESRDARQAALQARRDAFAAAATEPYDAARVRAAFERLRGADQAAIAVFQNKLIEALGEMSPDQRRAALEALRSAAPARRDGGVLDGERPVRGERLSPEQRETMQERREERRERWRARREQRQQQP